MLLEIDDIIAHKHEMQRKKALGCIGTETGQVCLWWYHGRKVGKQRNFLEDSRVGRSTHASRNEGEEGDRKRGADRSGNEVSMTRSTSQLNNERVLPVESYFVRRADKNLSKWMMMVPKTKAKGGNRTWKCPSMQGIGDMRRLMEEPTFVYL
ncbi:hypothetical protein BJ165DRAFT_1404590 [Panaeolus papilionaceus]|nr:hypothetical protein BJ165DRAFT_1404590 [Panaeolus papilionaceus]